MGRERVDDKNDESTEIVLPLSCVVWILCGAVLGRIVPIF